MFQVTNSIQIPESEVELNPIRSQGSGGQNVNKVSSAIHLRFDIVASSLPDWAKQRLCNYSDMRISKQGVIVIKAQNHRDQLKNKQDALARFCELLKAALHRQKTRIPTRPSRAAKQRRLDSKNKKSLVKRARQRVKID